jgi:hypothetical protein
LKTRRQFVREQRLPGEKLPPAQVALLNIQDKTLLVRIVDRRQAQATIEQLVQGNSQVQLPLNCVAPGVIERHYRVSEPDGTQREEVQTIPEQAESLYLVEVFVPAEEFGRLSPGQNKGPVFRQGYKRLGEFEIGLNDLQPQKVNRLDIVRRSTEPH